jgi:hypothetical protein
MPKDKTTITNIKQVIDSSDEVNDIITEFNERAAVDEEFKEIKRRQTRRNYRQTNSESTSTNNYNQINTKFNRNLNYKDLYALDQQGEDIPPAIDLSETYL